MKLMIRERITWVYGKVSLVPQFARAKASAIYGYARAHKANTFLALLVIYAMFQHRFTALNMATGFLGPLALPFLPLYLVVAGYLSPVYLLLAGLLYPLAAPILLDAVPWAQTKVAGFYLSATRFVHPYVVMAGPYLYPGIGLLLLLLFIRSFRKRYSIVKQE